MNEAKKIAVTKNTKYWKLKPKELNPAGVFTLDYAMKIKNKNSILKKTKSLRLYHVFINLIDNKIKKEKHLISEKDL